MKTAIEIGQEILAITDVAPMTENQTKIFVAAMMAERNKTTLPQIDYLGYQILKKRLAYYQIPVTDPAILFVSSLADRPGIVVMYAAVLAAIYAKEQKEVNIDMVATAFPVGFPKEERLHEVWEGQKIHDGAGPDNMLDRHHGWRK